MAWWNSVILDIASFHSTHPFAVSMQWVDQPQCSGSGEHLFFFRRPLLSVLFRERYAFVRFERSNGNEMCVFSAVSMHISQFTHSCMETRCYLSIRCTNSFSIVFFSDYCGCIMQSSLANSFGLQAAIRSANATFCVPFVRMACVL